MGTVVPHYNEQARYRRSVGVYPAQPRLLGYLQQAEEHTSVFKARQAPSQGYANPVG